VSRTPARHRKPPRPPSARPGAHARRPRPSPVTAALTSKPTLIAAAVAGSTLAVSAVAPAVAHWAGSAHRTTVLDQAGAALGTLPTAPATGAHPGQADTRTTAPAGLPAHASRTTHPSVRRTPAPAATPTPARARHAARRHASQQPAVAAPVYRNPLRGISGLIPERVDMGVDFGGSGPIYALGDGVVTTETTSAGWPGGGWVTYRLTDGPASGLMVFVAEDVTPDVQVGQTVTSSTVIATMSNSAGAGIETGWAMPDGSSAESQLPEAGGISGGGPFPTEVGLNFEALLQTLGVPAGPNRGDPPNGTLPPNYPTNWAAATRPR
jgi:murein DD-endopeptidase MepM/ murein hydrolase activator NlpD